MRKVAAVLALALSLASGSAAAETSEWAVDPTHARVGFSVPHMVVSEVEGQFKTFSGKVLLDEQELQKSKVDFTVDVASIDTGNGDRDKHLRSGDFFDAEKFPKMTFSSKKVRRAGKGYKVTGDLTLRGVTREVTFDVTVSDPVKNPWGKLVRGVRVNGKLKRSDFGVSWNKALDKGGVVVGDDVTVDIKLELNK